MLFSSAGAIAEWRPKSNRKLLSMVIESFSPADYLYPALFPASSPRVCAKSNNNNSKNKISGVLPPHRTARMKRRRKCHDDDSQHLPLFRLSASFTLLSRTLTETKNVYQELRKKKETKQNARSLAQQAADTSRADLPRPASLFLSAVIPLAWTHPSRKELFTVRFLSRFNTLL